MNPVYLEISERIRTELDELDRAAARVTRAWARAREAQDDQDLYIDSVALNLHGFYSGLERCFELIATHVDGECPSGETWHRDLLRQVAREVPGVRTAVIGDQSATGLDELRRFRHLIRNVYATNLIPDRMETLVKALPELWRNLRPELTSFASFLEALGRSE